MVDKALLVRGDHYGIQQALFFSLGDFTNLPQWKQFCRNVMPIHTYQHTVVFVFVLLKKKKKKDLSPLSASAGPFPLE